MSPILAYVFGVLTPVVLVFVLAIIKVLKEGKPAGTSSREPIKENVVTKLGD